MLNPLDMTGCTILVTGASSGIGRETAILLSHLGAKVILVARNKERLKATLTLMAGTGHVIEAYDLAVYEGIPSWIQQLAGAHGRLDGIAHSAGLQATAPLKVMEPTQSEALWRVNVSASLWLAKGFRQRAVCNSGGSLVFLASVAGLVGQPAIAAYSASKGAVIALTRSLAMELSREGIRVNCIAPGYVKTEMGTEFAGGLTPEHLAAIGKEHPLGFGEPVDVAYAVSYLLSQASRWVTGTTLVVDGGYTAH